MGMVTIMVMVATVMIMDMAMVKVKLKVMDMAMVKRGGSVGKLPSQTPMKKARLMSGGK